MTTEDRTPESAALLPPTLARHLGPDGATIQETAAWETTALFIDLGGFTALTEALTRFGSEGLSQLRSILNQFFGVVVDSVDACGGEVLRFEGDAVVCLFDEGFEHAARCGRVICDEDGSLVDTVAGLQTIRVSAGIGTGTVKSLLVPGDTRNHVVVLGDAISNAVAAQSGARSGAVATEGARKLIGHRGPSIAAPAPAFVDAIVLQRLSSGAGGLDDFRNVSAVFASIPEEPTVRQMQKAFAVLAVAGATPLTVTGDKGTSLLAAIGAPQAVPEQRRRALTAALELRALMGSETRVGLATGTVFCGLLGGPTRADYSMIGDRVNLAARLMQLAEPGEIVSDEATWAGVEAEYLLRDHRVVAVKGKVEPVVVASVVERSANEPSFGRRPPLVNQEDARSTLERAWQEAAAGRGSVLRLSGAVGSGKTRLLEDLASHVDGPVYTIRFPRYRTARPYEGFIPGLRALAGLDPDRPPRRGQIDAIANAYPDWSKQRGDYLARLLGAEGTAQRLSDAQQRTGKEILQSITIDLIATKVERGPIAILIDDGESADSASADLLSELEIHARQMAILIVVATRSAHRHATDDLFLVDLSRGHAEDLARSLDVDEHLIEQVGTNPLAVVMATESTGVATSDLRILSQSRIDQLDPPTRGWLRSASVFGREFPLQAARSAFGPVELRTLESSGFLMRLVGTAHETVAFSHDLLQEVAYQSLAVDQLSTLHESAGLALEASEPAAPPEELAHHFAHTGDVERQRRYFYAAGTRAAQAFEFSAAVEWFRRLKKVSGHSERMDFALSVGEWEEVLGNVESAIAEFEEALAGEGVVRVKALVGLARIRRHQGANEQSRGLLDKATDLATTIDDPAGRAAVLALRCEVGGDNVDAADIEESALELAGLAAALGDRVIAQAHHAIGTAHFQLLDGSGAREHLEEALIIADRIGDDLLSSQIRSDLAGTYFAEERLAEALLYLAAAGKDARRLGYRRGAAGMLGNEALLRYRLGDVHGALVRQHAALVELATMAEMSFTVQGIIRAGMCFRALGDVVAAEALLARAVEQSERTTQSAELAFSLHHLARLNLDRHEWSNAMERNEAARRLSLAAGFHALDLDFGILDVRAAAGAGDSDGALKMLTMIHDADKPDHEVAGLLYERWLITGYEQDRAAAADAYRHRHDLAPSAHTARRLGRLTGESVPLPEVADAGGDPPAPEAFLEFLR